MPTKSAPAKARKGAPKHLRPQQEWPRVDRELVEHLELLYPPRCMRPGEKIEDAMLYAGKVELVASLRAVYEGRHDAAMADAGGE